MLAAIVLAAGSAKRFGTPKQLATLEGECFLTRALRLAREAGASPVYVVLGAYAEEIRRRVDLSSVTVLVNAEWQQGMGSSLRLAALSVLSQSAAPRHTLLMVCDQPAVTTVHLQNLITAAKHSFPQTVASHYANHAGVPAILPTDFLPRLLLLSGDEGARALLAESNPLLVDLPGGEIDVDTLSDLKGWEERMVKNYLHNC